MVKRSIVAAAAGGLALGRGAARSSAPTVVAGAGCARTRSVRAPRPTRAIRGATRCRLGRGACIATGRRSRARIAQPRAPLGSGLRRATLGAPGRTPFGTGLGREVARALRPALEPIALLVAARRVDAATLADRSAAFVALRPFATTMDRGRIGERVATDLVEFLRREIAPLAHGKALQPQRPHLHPPQLLDRVSERQQHASDLAIATFEELHVENRLLAVAGDHVEPAGLGLPTGPPLTIAEEDAALEACQVVVGQLPRHRDLIALVHLVARVRETVGEFAVVGHQEQAR